jgi:hypothetical protein
MLLDGRSSKTCQTKKSPNDTMTIDFIGNCALEVWD